MVNKNNPNIKQKSLPSLKKDTDTSIEKVIEKYLVKNAEQVDKELHEYLAVKANPRYIENLIGKAGFKYDTDAITKSILEPSWYLLKLGGKRFRPALTRLVLETYGKNSLDYIEFAIIPEVIHNSTLIKDDIEDGSDVRRGAPAVHVHFGLDVAANASDFMYFFPMKALVDSSKLSAEVKNRASILYFTDMTRISIGQATDLAWHRGMVDIRNITVDQYLEMARDKTGVLTGFAMALGGILAGVDSKTESKLDTIGSLIGVIFQIQDDILNIYPSELSTNKGGVGDDISEGKITLMVIHALQNASEEDKEKLIGILSEHTKDKKKISEAITLIGKYGSVEYARTKAEEIEKEVIDLISSTLQESEAKEILKNLVHYLIIRNK